MNRDPRSELATPDSELLSNVLDSMPFAVTTLSPDGTILFVNVAAARNLSRSRETIVGTSVFDYFPDRALATRERLKQAVTQKTVQHFEAVVSLPDGTKRHFDSTYCPALGPDGEVTSVQIVARDIAETRPSAEASDAQRRLWGVVTDDLSMTEERVAALLENAPMIVSVQDPDMTIRYMNRVPSGAKGEELIGKWPIEHVTPGSRPQLLQAFTRVLETGSATECTIDAKSGRSWLVRFAPLKHEGTVRQVLGCTLEVTEQRRLLAQLAHERKIESLGTMASGIAHDFNNLLTAILGNTSLARHLLASGNEAADLLHEVETAAKRATEICDQMLVYAGRDRKSTQPGELNRVIREMARLTRAAVNSRIVLTYELGRGLPPARCDRAKLGQVVLNLINNAADAIGARQGRITVRTDLLELSKPLDDFLPSPPPSGRYVRLRVSDDGPGMNVDAQQRMFDPFYSTKVAGHGLGLSVVLGIVSSNEAAIGVTSEAGKGTTMTVLFPASDTAHAVSADTDEAIPSSSGGTILVVDDEKAVRELASHVLSDAGYRVLRAEDGDAALGLLAAHGSTIRAVLLDVTMPGRDGHSTLTELRKSHPELPVVFSSGAPLEPLANDGFVRVLTKPYTASKLARAVAKAIDGSFGTDDA